MNSNNFTARAFVMTLIIVALCLMPLFCEGCATSNNVKHPSIDFESHARLNIDLGGIAGATGVGKEVSKTIATRPPEPTVDPAPIPSSSVTGLGGARELNSRAERMLRQQKD